MWQISGRSNTTFAERAWFDEYYVRNWSPWLDLYILGYTVNVVLRCDGAY
jgi:lipopolysaccharide/colanic/teichoic acid biosynthesis glycosyltransferase